jgi:oxygen-dependent protoporphyrinogen oxidase
MGAVLGEWRVPQRQQQQQNAGGDDNGDDESVHSFLSRRFSPEVARTLGDALVLGIFAGRSEQLSVKSCFPKLYELEKKYGSVSIGMLKEAWRSRREKRKFNKDGSGTMSKMIKTTQDVEKLMAQTMPVMRSPFVQKIQAAKVYSFKNGIETLTNTMAESLGPCTMLGTEVTAIRRASSSGLEIELKDGRVLGVDEAISALPSNVLARIVEKRYPELGHALSHIPFASVAVIHLGYQNWHGPKLDGFGHLVPTSEGEPILGVQWNSVTFPQQDLILSSTSSSSSTHNRMRLTVMARVEPGQEKLNENDWLEIAKKSVAKQMGVTQDPDVTNVAVNMECIPQHVVGHSRLVERIFGSIEKELPGLYLVGNSYSGVGVNDCVVSAMDVVKKMERTWQSLAATPSSA